MVLLASLRDRLFSLSSRNLSIFIRVWIVSLDTDVLNCRRSKFISSTQDNFRNTFSCCQDVYYIMDLTVSSKRAVVKPFLRVHKQWKYWVLINCWSKGFFHNPSKNRVKVYFLDMYLFIVLCIVFINTNDNHTYVIFQPPSPWKFNFTL